jgi:hypothetical protein
MVARSSLPIWPADLQPPHGAVWALGSYVPVIYILLSYPMTYDGILFRCSSIMSFVLTRDVIVSR